MRLAEARLSASIMMSCSMIASLIGAAWLWMHERVAAAHGLVEAYVDLAVGEVVGGGRARGSISRRSATSCASVGCERPENSSMFRVGVRLDKLLTGGLLCRFG